MKNLKIEKIHLYALIKPYDIIIALSFFSNETIGVLQSFIEDTLRNLKSSSYKVGRVEKKLNDAILLPQYKISDFLKDNDEIIIYSIDYGLTKKSLPKDKNVEDIDFLFIGKKLKKVENKTNRSSFDSTKKSKRNKEKDNNDNESESNNQSKSNNYSNEEEENEEEEDEEENKKNKYNKYTKESDSDIELNEE